MSRDARKKEKHRLKRKEKQQRLRKLNARTALQRIASEGGQLECWVMPDDWKQQGICSIRILGHAPGGHAATASFLVDLWAVGLKDAFGRSDVPALAFREDNIDPWIEKSGAVKIDPQTARRLVAGGVRFGRQNSFRMPPEWEKWVAIFGRDILDEIPNADLSEFGVAEGGVRYVGSMEFLERRLSIPPETFLGRPDVHWVIGPDPGSAGMGSMSEFGPAPDEIDEETAEHINDLRKVTEDVAAKVAEDVRAWCEAHGKEPVPRLRDAARAVMFSLMPAIDVRLTGRRPNDDDFSKSERLGAMILAQHPPAERKAIEESVVRLREYMTEMGREKPEAAATAEPSTAHPSLAGSSPDPGPPAGQDHPNDGANA